MGQRVRDCFTGDATTRSFSYRWPSPAGVLESGVLEVFPPLDQKETKQGRFGNALTSAGS